MVTRWKQPETALSWRSCRNSARKVQQLILLYNTCTVEFKDELWQDAWPKYSTYCDTAESVNNLIWNVSKSHDWHVTCAQVLLCSRTCLMWRIFYSKKNWSVLSHSRTSSSSFEPIMSTTLKLRYDITSFVYMLCFCTVSPKLRIIFWINVCFFLTISLNDWLFWWQAGLDEYCDWSHLIV